MFSEVPAEFKVYKYIVSEFYISCNQTNIIYGEKAKCSVVKAFKEQLSEIQFDIIGSATKI